MKIIIKSNDNLKTGENNFPNFPIEVVTEGTTLIIVPKLEAYVEKTWEYAPSKAPVFYNPTMELNRDIAVLALQTYQRTADKEISVCEPLTGCGIRGIRFAREVNGVQKIVVNDINLKAAKLAKLNAERNKLAERVLVMNEDANLLLSRYAAPRKRYDYIDVDPFGSPAPYLDSAVRALRHGGLLALTATDLAPLCGVHPKACVRKYGGRPLRTGYCHELAVRLLVGCLTMTAAKHEKGVETMFSHSTDHYIRTYAVVHRGAKQSDKSVLKMGYILHCFACFHREVSKGIFPPWKRECTECGSKLNVAGPLWLGKIFDKEFCALMAEEVAGRNLGREKRILKLLSLVRKEADAPVTYYAMDKICDKLNLRIPPLTKTMDELRGAGFQAVPTHFNSRGIRTDASAKTVKEIITRLAA
ncbi:MAG: tRNA (guanine(10)-N(2))-dimethyltransferase [Candidatus Bathyarchaeota archaeon]|nr:MAG: tRNA (guanine(10)-N(2))-dimethyltransferase [Candidatus Bathyarchaeota archaeon]